MKKLILFSLFLCLNMMAFGQNDSTQTPKPLLFELKLKDGTILYGNVISQDTYKMEFKTENLGIIKFDKSNIDTIKQIEKIEQKQEDKNTWFKTTNRTRYFFAPSAYNLEKGELYYQNSYLTLNMFNYGITNNFSMMVGFESITTLLGRPIFLLSPKYSGQIAKNWRLGVGILYANGFNKDFGGFGIAYGTTTYGTDEHNLSLGMGYGFVQSSWAKNPVYTLSGMTRLTKRFGLVSENWIIPIDNNYYGLLSFGFRIIGEQMTFDFALARPTDFQNSDMIAFPYIDILIKLK